MLAGLCSSDPLTWLSAETPLNFLRFSALLFMCPLILTQAMVSSVLLLSISDANYQHEETICFFKRQLSFLLRGRVMVDSA